nr:hypothetical protein [Tanacetum cinerariifolium]
MPGGFVDIGTWEVGVKVMNCSGMVQVYGGVSWGRKGNKAILARKSVIRQLGWGVSLRVVQVNDSPYRAVLVDQRTWRSIGTRCWDTLSNTPPDSYSAASHFGGVTERFHEVPRNSHNKDIVVGKNYQIGHNRDSKNHNSG